MAEVSITLKGGAAFESPWIVIRADNVTEARELAQELREQGAFGAVKTMAYEFAHAQTAADAVEAVRAVFPKAEVISEGPAAAAPAVVGGGVQQTTPPCSTCGQPTSFREGNNPKTGDWSAYMCSSGDRTHTQWL